MTETSYCRRDRRETRWIRSGGQNGDRPITVFWRCVTCSTERVALANVSDVEALARTVLSERRPPHPEDDAPARLDYDDAVGTIVAAIYEAYVEWDPARNPSFLSHATWKARLALTDWYREELGRDTPKAHAWAYSVDALAEPDDSDREDTVIHAPVAMAEASISHAIVLIEDPETSDTLRRIAKPIAEGYSHAEVAAMVGLTEAAVSARLRRLRARADLRA
jgi:hypothetical protein